ncbi:MAG: D-tyrosyl-tRNA(Tyr) deacylase [Armatimonadetes bacterium]|nr:D-tyrosyl-tRNA(Tyr) deacylase [Armatimonadota bacterium]MDE2207816.1 D-tyrosyl-tRNA(Tyr) deacylase [Armatimonadota bacterium]
MRAVVQRVCSASVTSVDDGIETVLGSIGAGLAVLVGVAATDDADGAERLASRILNLRIFVDTGGRLNRSLLETGGQALVVPNFTLCADCDHGRRPSFTGAARGDIARSLFQHFADTFDRRGVVTARGSFGADMRVSLVNDGPVTLIIGSPADRHDAGNEPSAGEITVKSATPRVEVL